jgi:hypothetical protein
VSGSGEKHFYWLTSEVELNEGFTNWDRDQPDVSEYSASDCVIFDHVTGK